jgi:hypothetical protein
VIPFSANHLIAAACVSPSETSRKPVADARTKPVEDTRSTDARAATSTAARERPDVGDDDLAGDGDGVDRGTVTTLRLGTTSGHARSP